jgi:hypothetical protein
MIHIGRCGSTVVGMMLNQHSNIKWAGEILESPGTRCGKQSWVFENPLEMVALRCNISMCKVFGFEMKDGQFDELKIDITNLKNKMEEVGKPIYIILERKNYLKAKVSTLVGKRIGKWSTNEDVDPPQVEVPTRVRRGKSLIDEFDEWNNFYRKAEKALQSCGYLKLTYENDIKRDPHKGYKKVISYLGLDKSEAEVKTKKINDRPIEERIKNFKEVSELLAGTKHEWMTD